MIFVPKRISPYREQQILSASPLELVALSYQLAIEAVQEAREELTRKDIRARVKAIARAQAIIVELHRALNFDTGDGMLAKELSRLYHYAMQLLLEASREENDEKLAQVMSILSTLGDGWEQIAHDNRADAMVSTPAYAWETVDFGQESRCSVSY